MQDSSGFYIDRQAASGLEAQCKDCRRETRRSITQVPHSNPTIRIIPQCTLRPEIYETEGVGAMRAMRLNYLYRVYGLAFTIKL